MGFMDAFSRKDDDVAPEEAKVDTKASQGSNREIGRASCRERV